MRSFQSIQKREFPGIFPYLTLIILQIKPLFQNSKNVHMSLLSIGIIDVTIPKEWLITYQYWYIEPPKGKR